MKKHRVIEIFLIVIVSIAISSLLLYYAGNNNEEYCGDMSLSEAQEIAIASECGDNLKETHMCNEATNTWWIDLDIEKEGCNPACVINVETKEASINWRCMGLK